MITEGTARAPARPIELFPPRPQRSFWGDAWRRFRRQRASLGGALFVLGVVLVAVFAPLVAPTDPNFISGAGLKLGVPVPPGTPGFPLGADDVGRDVLSRIIFGARVSLAVALLANACSLIVGFSVGAVAGYLGGAVGAVLMRVTDSVISIPPILLALGLTAVLSPGLGVVIFVITVIYWTYLARIVFGQVRSLREGDFVTAARSVGCTETRILLRHILPQLLGTAIVYASLSAANMILTESTLSFLGIGVRPPNPSWGQMLSSGPNDLLVAPWVVIFPGLVVTCTVLGFNLLGDGLRDAFDPRSQR